jgi:hypothetical protein
MPSPLKKIVEEFVPAGTDHNLRITDGWLADNFEPPTLGIHATVMDGDYEGEPVEDYLHIQESKYNVGELYISKKGKMARTLTSALTVKEYNALADELAKVEASRVAWIERIAAALKNAENPVFRSEVVQNEPEDPTNRRNKLTSEPERIGPYIDPEEAEEVYRKVHGKRETEQEAEQDFNDIPF